MTGSHSSNYQGRIYQVAVPSPLRRCFDYLPPGELSIRLAKGVRVLVPFGRRQVVGVITGSASNSELPASKLKAIVSVIDNEPLLPKSMLKLLDWAAEYYQHPIGDVYSTAWPAKLRALQKPNKYNVAWTISKNASALLENSFGKAHRQQALFEFIAANNPASTTAVKEAGFNSSLLRQLQEKKLIEATQQSDSPARPFSSTTVEQVSDLTLNSEQQHAVQTINDSDNAYRCFLIDGITGSGKTEVYMQVMAKQLQQGRQCLVLVPEIGLTPQTITRFEQRFTCPVVALHSGLNDSERLHAWQQSRRGEAGIVLGTRSAIFTPLLNPGIIIIDEEHDSSFKQQEGFRYSARDLAVIRGREEKIPVLLGSATPSLESLANCKNKKFECLPLTKRAGRAVPATLQLVDSSEQALLHGFTSFTLDSIAEHLQQLGQVLVFINRRGFAPVVSCETCGWTAECESCETQFTVHSNPPGLRCHHCGAAQRVPSVCPHCQTRNLSTTGIGTQQVEGFLSKSFPATPVIRIDRDSTRRKNSLDEKLGLIQKGEPCLLIGTQMIAKGHHFPAISLVVILDADSGLFSADFRGLEHMAQTIVQVAGRSGREKRQGAVIIQSRHVSHEAVVKLSSLPYRDYAEYLLTMRKEAAMPPYANLALIRAESPAFAAGMKLLTTVSKQGKQLIRDKGLDVESLGPLPAPMEKRAGRYRLQLILKASSRAQLHQLLALLVSKIEAIRVDSKTRWSIDIDPQDLI